MEKSNRQTLFVLGAVAIGYSGLRILPSLLPQEIVFEEMDAPSGFRRFVAGESSSAFDPFIGLGTSEELEAAAKKVAASARVSANVCDALYGELTLSSSQVPLASFSDYYCPFSPASQSHEEADRRPFRSAANIRQCFGRNGFFDSCYAGYYKFDQLYSNLFLGFSCSR